MQGHKLCCELARSPGLERPCLAPVLCCCRGLPEPHWAEAGHSPVATEGPWNLRSQVLLVVGRP